MKGNKIWNGLMELLNMKDKKEKTIREKKKEKLFIAVDFDGTCVEHIYPLIGEDAPGAVNTLKDLVKAGYKLILFTMRCGSELAMAIRWFKDRDIPLYSAQYNPEQITWTQSNKCYANIYIDDSAFGCPLIHPVGFVKPCIDWDAVRKALL